VAAAAGRHFPWWKLGVTNVKASRQQDGWDKTDYISRHLVQNSTQILLLDGGGFSAVLGAASGASTYIYILCISLCQLVIIHDLFICALLFVIDRSFIPCIVRLFILFHSHRFFVCSCSKEKEQFWSWTVFRYFDLVDGYPLSRRSTRCTYSSIPAYIIIVTSQ
jgi:hypothetical protein